MKHHVPMAVCDVFTSVFADTGENMNLKPNAIREKAETDAMIPRWVRVLKPVWIVHHRLRRLAAGHFNLKPTSYAIYTLQSPDRRVRLMCPNRRRSGGTGCEVRPAGMPGTAGVWPRIVSTRAQTSASVTFHMQCGVGNRQ